MNQADRDRARIAELRRQARVAQGLPDAAAEASPAPIEKWRSGVGEISHRDGIG